MSSARARLLVVEDEELIGRGLIDLLSFHGYEVAWEPDGDGGLRAALTGKHDLVLLDVMLPGRDGFEVCRLVREELPSLPILMLTAKGAEDDIVVGLEAGADDYVTKPFSTRELLLRIEAILRRSGKLVATSTFEVGHHEIDGETLVARSDGGEQISLTRREWELLSYLHHHRERIVSRQELLEHVWGYPGGRAQTRTVDIHVGKLRRKLERAPDRPELILTIHGEGYRLGSPV